MDAYQAGRFHPGRTQHIRDITSQPGKGRGPAAHPQGVASVKGFRAFINRGNLISLAIAIVIGTAFTAMVTALVADIITPLIAAIAGKPNFGSLHFTIHRSTFQYGLFLNAVLSFLLIALVVYYLIVAPSVKLSARLTRTAEATTRDCPECLSTIPIAATRCMYCTSQVPPVNPTPAPQTQARHRAVPQFHQPHQQQQQPQQYQ
jgi:large conductance mechanosensitive channel